MADISKTERLAEIWSRLAAAPPAHSHDEVYQLLSENRDLVEALRDELIAHEEIMGDEIANVIEKTLAQRNGSYRPAKRSDSGMVVAATDDTSV